MIEKGYIISLYSCQKYVTLVQSSENSQTQTRYIWQGKAVRVKVMKNRGDQVIVRDWRKLGDVTTKYNVGVFSFYNGLFLLNEIYFFIFSLNIKGMF